MPRRGPVRALRGERNVAARVKVERTARGWTFDRLAQEMETVGCPIQRSSLRKIEDGDPPRRINVDELLAFSEVFEVEVTELLLPPELATAREALRTVDAWIEQDGRAHQLEMKAAQSVAKVGLAWPDFALALMDFRQPREVQPDAIEGLLQPLRELAQREGTPETSPSAREERR